MPDIFASYSLVFLALLSTGLLASSLGSMIGSGSGILLVPALVLLFKVPMHSAAATSLVCIVATSVAAQVTYLRSGYSRVELALILEVMAVAGALVGSMTAMHIEARWLEGLFALVLVYAALSLFWPSGGTGEPEPPGRRPAGTLGLGKAAHLPWAAAGTSLAGVLSGMLGIGGGPVNMVLLSLVVQLPLKVAVATSNLMVGITVVAGSLVYYGHGLVQPGLVAPCLLGSLLGARLGARLAVCISRKALVCLVAITFLLIASQMAWKAVGES